MKKWYFIDSEEQRPRMLNANGWNNLKGRIKLLYKGRTGRYVQNPAPIFCQSERQEAWHDPHTMELAFADGSKTANKTSYSSKASQGAKRLRNEEGKIRGITEKKLRITSYFKPKIQLSASLQ